MVDINNIRVGSQQIKDYNGHSASSFWMGNQMNSFQDEESTRGLNHTKLVEVQRAIANFVTIVTGKHIPVIFKGQESYTDGKEVVISTKTDDNGFDSTVGLALHEGSHIAHTDFSMTSTGMINALIKNELPKSQWSSWLASPDKFDQNIISKVFCLMNWIEDRRIDFLVYHYAPGYRMYYEAMYDKYFNSKIIDKALLSKVKNQESWDDYIFHIINFVNPKRDLKLLKKLQEIWDMIDLANISRLKNTRDSVLLAINVYSVISKTLEEPKPQEQKGNIDNQNQEDRKKQNSPDKKKEKENKEDQKLPKLTERQQKQLQNAIEKQQEFINGKTKKEGRRLSKKDTKLLATIKESGTEIVSVKYDIRPERRRTYHVKDPIVDTLVIRKLNESVIDTFPRYFKSQYYQEQLIQSQQEVIQNAIVIGKQLGRKLKLRTEERSLKTTRLQQGRIDKRLIAQIGAGMESIFHQVITDKYKNFFIHISIDASGSMGGSKWENALSSAVAIAQAASMTEGIRVQISIRGTGMVPNSDGIDRTRPVTIYAYDSKTDKMSKIRKLFKYLDTFGATPEGFSFKSIEKFILKDAQREECLFINYSDGMPSTFGNGETSADSVEFTKRVIDRFREHGMQILSFFIEDSDYRRSVWDKKIVNKFKRMYGRDAEFIDTSSIPKVAKLLNNKFLEQHVA